MTLKGEAYDPNMFQAHYLDKGWRYRLIYNYSAAPTENWTSRIK